MSRDYDEKRDFFRMAADCPLTYKTPGNGVGHSGRCINLSAGGVLFSADEAINAGTQIEINITPDKTVVPPLNAVIEVIRNEPSSQQGMFDHACRIIKLL
jgi:hypothetical protein